MATLRAFRRGARQPGFGQSLQVAVSGLGHRLAAAVKRLQYGRMVAVLDRMPDRHLEAIGVTRPEIPRYAHRLIYGDD